MVTAAARRPSREWLCAVLVAAGVAFLATSVPLLTNTSAGVSPWTALLMGLGGAGVASGILYWFLVANEALWYFMIAGALAPVAVALYAVAIVPPPAFAFANRNEVSISALMFAVTSLAAGGIAMVLGLLRLQTAPQQRQRAELANRLVERLRRRPKNPRGWRN